jgi:hypothetical protein
MHLRHNQFKLVMLTNPFLQCIFTVNGYNTCYNTYMCFKLVVRLLQYSVNDNVGVVYHKSNIDS